MPWSGAAALLVLLGAALCGNAWPHGSATPVVAPSSAPVPGSYRLPPLRLAPDALLRDESGANTSLRAAARGRITVLSFIYTHCSDGAGCPLATHTLSLAAASLAKSPAVAARVRFLSVSFDPTRDTPAVLETYASHFRKPGLDWRFLALAPEEVIAATTAYGQDLADDGANGLAHQLRVFLLDADGRLRNEYTAGFLDAATLAADIETVLIDPPQAAPTRPSTSLEAGDQRKGYDDAGWTTQSRALDARDAQPLDLAARLRRPAAGLPPLPFEIPSAARIALGRRLFFDRRLSHNSTLSCASCHVPDQGFTSHELRTPLGVEGRSVRRNAPTLLNVGFLPRLFLDAREERLEQQVWAPLLAHNEMANVSIGEVLSRIRALPDYPEAFDVAFPRRGLDMTTLGLALAAYEQSLVAGNSPFDRWRASGVDTRLPAAAREGYALFTGKAGCSSCHTVARTFARFTDDALHNTGIGYRQSMQSTSTLDVTVAPGTQLEVATETIAASSEPPATDLGRYEVTGDPADRWRYRTPSLRNVAVTAPYMHDGSLPTLAAVVAFYAAGGVPNEGLDARIHPLQLTATEQAALVAFLESLTSLDLPELVRDAYAAPIGDRRSLSLPAAH